MRRIGKQHLGAWTALAIAGALALGLGGMAMGWAVPQAQAKAAVKIGKAQIASVKSQDPRQVTVKVKKVKWGVGVHCQLSYDGKFGKVAKSKTNGDFGEMSFSKLKQGRTVFVRARGYRWHPQDGHTVYGKWSPTKSVKVKRASAGAKAPAPKAEEARPPVGWDRSTPGWSFPYKYKIKVLNRPSAFSSRDTGIRDTFLFLETDAPASAIENIRIYFSSARTLAEDSAWHSIGDAIDGIPGVNLSSSTRLQSREGHTTWYSVHGGYLTATQPILYGCPEEGEDVEVGLVDIGDDPLSLKGSNDFKHEHVGKIHFDNADGEEEELARLVVADACDPAADKPTQMWQACFWIRRHSRYPDVFSGDESSGEETGGYCYFLGEHDGLYDGTGGDNFLRYKLGKKMIHNSSSSPDFLETVGKVLGYPVKSLYDKYPQFSEKWMKVHFLVQSVEDGKHYWCCPDISTGIVPWHHSSEIPDFDPAEVKSWWLTLEPGERQR